MNSPSKFASVALVLFLGTCPALAVQAQEPPRDPVRKIVLDLIRMNACQISWNYHVNERIAAGSEIANVEMQDPVSSTSSVDAKQGIKYTFSTNYFTADVCGWYFLPGDDSSDTGRAALAQFKAITAINGHLADAAFKMNDIVAADSKSDSKISFPVSDFHRAIEDAVTAYNNSLSDSLSSFGIIKKSAYAQASMPVTSPPPTDVSNNDKPVKSLFGTVDIDNAWNIRMLVLSDMISFNKLIPGTPY